MPRSVRVAIASACLVALLGAVSTAIWIADAAAGGWASRWLSTVLRGNADAFQRAVSPLYLAAIAVVPIALRRDARKVRVAVQLALLATITLGISALGLFGPALTSLRLDAELAAMLAAPAMLGLMAWSLSRPSARAWFASGERPG
ncbi:MAG TPA: hypothetical protein VIV57_07935 [Anaeromyxobacter sp.]